MMRGASSGFLGETFELVIADLTPDRATFLIVELQALLKRGDHDAGHRMEMERPR